MAQFETNIGMREICVLFKFSFWLFCFGLSFLLGIFEWVDQGTIFLVIYLCLSGVLSLCLSGALEKMEALEFNSAIVLTVGIVHYAILLAQTLPVTWIVTKIVDVDFCTVFQITSLVQCLYVPSRGER